MDFEKIKLKDIKCISFCLDNLDYIKGNKENFITQNAKISSVTKEKGKLKIIVSEGKNKAVFKMSAKNNQGRNALALFLMSSNFIGTSLVEFPNLEFGHFKKQK